MEKKKKINNIIVVILILVVIALVITIFTLTHVKEQSIITSSQYVKNNSMTKEEALNLAEKGANCSNWYMIMGTIVEAKRSQNAEELDEPNDESAVKIISESYCKDDVVVYKMKEFNKQETLSWTNYATGNNIRIYNGNGEKTIQTNSLSETERQQPKINENLIEDLKNNKNKYEYLGETKFQEIHCIVIKLTNEENALDEVYYIDSETGVTLKNVQEFSNATFTIFYNIDYNVVTDENIAKPDLVNYAEYKIIE